MITHWAVKAFSALLWASAVTAIPPVQTIRANTSDVVHVC